MRGGHPKRYSVQYEGTRVNCTPMFLVLLHARCKVERLCYCLLLFLSDFGSHKGVEREEKREKGNVSDDEGQAILPHFINICIPPPSHLFHIRH